MISGKFFYLQQKINRRKGYEIKAVSLVILAEKSAFLKKRQNIEEERVLAT